MYATHHRLCWSLQALHILLLVLKASQGQRPVIEGLVMQRPGLVHISVVLCPDPVKNEPEDKLGGS